MKRRMIFALLACAATSFAASPVTIQAQTPPTSFVSYDNAPFGPGDRAMKLSIQLAAGETNANTELWVLYGQDRATVASASLGGRVAQARVQLDTVSGAGVASGTFIFPHRDNGRPNMTDTNPATISSGRTVHYKLVKKRGATATPSPVVTFTMPDKLTIANFGDSYASGEGSPYASGDKWDNELCHRSGNSGQARAVKTIKEENPGIAIAFKNVACSGAQVAEGILLSQKKATWFGEGEELQTVVKPQLMAVRDWMAGNGYAELNIAMVSGGGNDVNFGLFVEKYFVFFSEFKADSPEYNNLRTSIANDVPQLYRSLQQAFEQNFTYDRVLVSEYPDPMRGANGLFCDAEHNAMNSAFLIPLNDAVRTTIGTFPKFRHVGGAMAKSRYNGLCNDEIPYFNNDLIASFWTQGDAFGIVHPNRRGHREIYKPLYEVQLRQAIRDIQIKWAKIKARDDARAKAATEQLVARTELATAMRGGLPLKAIRVTRISPAIKLSSAEKMASSKQIAAAAVAAKGKPVQTFGIPDNRMPDDDE
jgi:hypothetical protein